MLTWGSCQTPRSPPLRWCKTAAAHPSNSTHDAAGPPGGVRGQRSYQIQNQLGVEVYGQDVLKTTFIKYNFKILKSNLFYLAKHNLQNIYYNDNDNTMRILIQYKYCTIYKLYLQHPLQDVEGTSCVFIHIYFKSYL